MRARLTPKRNQLLAALPAGDFMRLAAQLEQVPLALGASSELVMTQQLIANMLGVRREGVTEAAGRLQADGVISFECYAVVRRESRRLFESHTIAA